MLGWSMMMKSEWIVVDTAMGSNPLKTLIDTQGMAPEENNAADV